LPEAAERDALQWWVLAYLSREDGMTQSQLAEELDLGKVAVGA